MFAYRLRALATLGVLFLLLAVCDTMTPIDTAHDFHVSLVNDSPRQAQILSEGESPDASHILAPNASREITFSDAEDGDVFRFRALIFEEAVGGAWLEVANQACLFDAEFRARIVSYRGGIALVCENW